jgi:hypothetical protein
MPAEKLVGFEATKGGSLLIFIHDVGKILHSCILPFKRRTNFYSG